MSAMMLNSVWHTISAKNAPTPADGSVDKIVTGWMLSFHRERPATM